MPLVQINCIKAWYPPDDSTTALASQPWATICLARALTALVADAVNKCDVEHGALELTPNDVFVNYGRIHAQAINAADVQIVIMASIGDPTASGFHQAMRRAKIRNAVHEGLKELIEANPDTPDEARSVWWPGFDIEVGLQSFTGFAVSPQGKIEKSWGDPRME